MEKITIQSTKLNQLPSGPKLAIKTVDGRRYNCKEESLFDILIASADKELEVKIEDSMIIEVASAEVKAEPKPEPKPAKPAPEKKAPEVPAKNKPVESQKAETPDTVNEPIFTGDVNIARETEGLTEADKLNHATLFPLMRADEIEIRVGQIYDWGLTLLLYKDARCDQERLDQKFGPMNWQKAYTSIDGRLYCIVSVKNSETGEWVAKSDVGTESNTEAEKGLASDSFKRACVVWGSGRELYSAPAITVKAADTVIEKNTKGKLVCKDSFIVKKIAYDSQRRISELQIYSAQKKRVVFSWKKG